MASPEIKRAAQLAAQTKPIETPRRTDQSDVPSMPSAAYQRMTQDWELCRDLYAGSRAIQEKGEQYLPKFPREDDAVYCRRKAVKVYNAFARTIRAMAGMVFQRAPELGDDVAAPIKAHSEDIDGKGTHIRIFLRSMLRDGLITGIGGILVDYPPIDNPSAVTLADEKRLHLRPYWVQVMAEDILSARIGKIGSRIVLTQLVLREVTEEAVGEFGARDRTQYRVFRRSLDPNVAEPVTFELWEDKDTGEKVETVRVQDARPVRNQTEIPFAPFFADEEIGPFETRPPLLDLAELNLDHWRVSTDRRSALTLAGSPQPVITGYASDDGEIVIGPSTAIVLSRPEAKFEWKEISGTSFGPTKDELEMIERHMAAIALAFLMSETRAAETAEAKRIDSAAQNASLTAAVDGLEDAAERALGFHAAYMKLQPGSITLNREFVQTVLASDMIAQMLAAAIAGKLSLETFLEVLKRGNVLPDDVDVETEKERIMLDGGLGDYVPPDPNVDPAGSGSGDSTDPTIPPGSSPGDRAPAASGA